MSKTMAVDKHQIKIDRLELANRLEKECRRSIASLLIALKIINDQMLFVELGYDSMTEFCEGSLSQSADSIRRYMCILDKFSNVPNKTLPGEILAKLDSKEGFSDFRPMVGNILDALPYKKLYEISRLPKEVVDEFVKTEVLQLGQHSFSIQQLKEIERNSLQKIISTHISPGIVNEDSSEEKDKPNLTVRMEKKRTALVKSAVRFDKLCRELAPPSSVKELEIILDKLNTWLEDNWI